MNPPGCVQAKVNDLRHGRIVEPLGTIRLDQTGRFFNVDLRISKMFRFGENLGLSTYIDLYNLTNEENLS